MFIVNLEWIEYEHVRKNPRENGNIIEPSIFYLLQDVYINFESLKRTKVNFFWVPHHMLMLFTSEQSFENKTAYSGYFDWISRTYGGRILKKNRPSYLAAKKQWKTRCHSKFQSGGIIYITQDNSVEPFRQIINDQLYLKKGIVVEIKTVKKI